MGIFQVAIVWGIGISTAIYLTGSLSGAHLNPAVTVGFAVWTDFVGLSLYFLAQFIGAFLASVALFVMYHGVLDEFEASHHIVRGAPGSEASAMIFGEFYPNPGGRPLTDAVRNPNGLLHRGLGYCDPDGRDTWFGRQSERLSPAGPHGRHHWPYNHDPYLPHGAPDDGGLQSCQRPGAAHLQFVGWLGSGSIRGQRKRMVGCVHPGPSCRCSGRRRCVQSSVKAALRRKHPAMKKGVS